MQEWDETIAHGVSQRFGVKALRTLAYKIIGDTDGIAVSEDDHVFARVALVLDSADGSSIVEGILVVNFSGNSCQLNSATWTTTATLLAGRAAPSDVPNSPLSSSSETLGSQMVYPSVVSLDHEKAEEVQGPGMHI